MTAIDKEAPGLDRAELAAHLGDPVNLGQFGQGKGPGPEGQRQHVQHRLVGLFQKVGANLPQAAVVLDFKDTDAGRVRVHPFQRRRKRVGSLFAGQRGQGGEGGHERAFRGDSPRLGPPGPEVKRP